MSRKETLVETISRAYAAASPEEQAALRPGLRNMVVPQSEPRKESLKVSQK